jgi:hypothetical protein
MAGVSRHGGDDGADKRGPVVRETRGRRPAREGVVLSSKLTGSTEGNDLVRM